MQTIEVTALPAYKFKEANPFTWLLYTSISECSGNSFKVLEYRPFRGMAKQKILHVHWPDHMWNQLSLTRSIFRGSLFVVELIARKSMGCKVVWTAHNTTPHKVYHRMLNNLFTRVFDRLVSGVVYLSRATKEDVLLKHSGLKSKPSSYIPHGEYIRVLRPRRSKIQAREQLGLNQKFKIALFFGAIKSYKAVPELIRTFRTITDACFHLVVAGGVSEKAELDRINNATSESKQISLCLKHLDDDTLQLYIEACDLVVLPYKNILNSGSAIYALSNGRPILTIAHKTFEELGAIVGNQWVIQNNGEITAEAIQNALNFSLECTDFPNLEALGWAKISAAHTEFYRLLLNGRQT